MHIGVELVRADDGRLEGTVVPERGPSRPFSGTLELLQVLEGLDLARLPAPRSPRSADDPGSTP